MVDSGLTLVAGVNSASSTRACKAPLLRRKTATHFLSLTRGLGVFCSKNRMKHLVWNATMRVCAGAYRLQCFTVSINRSLTLSKSAIIELEETRCQL